jgi:hypothetical protein
MNYPNGSVAMNTVDVAGLLKQHLPLLQTKQIDNVAGLSEVLSFDFEKVFHALIEIQAVNVGQVLNNFFQDFSEELPPLIADVDKHQLSHVGFEICEPLDVVIANLPTWLTQLSTLFSKPVTLKKQLRFTASQAFQQRVNAFVEIFCIWLQIGEHGLMLELFDIGRPIAKVLPSGENALYLNNANKLDAQQHAAAMQYLFQNDTIWHYSISVANRAAVLQLHEDFKQLATQQPQYKLAYPAPIQNQYDGSFHTKLINLTRHLELEFVTHSLM